LINLTRRGMASSMLALMATGCATRTVQTAAPIRPKADIGDFGIDLDARDLSVKPGDDFYRYAGGTWFKNNQIPDDRTRWGSFDKLREKAERDSRAIIEEVARTGGAPGSKEQKIADFYNSYLNVDAIEAAGLAPAREDLAAIAGLRTHEDVIRMMAAPGIPVDSPIAIFVTLDERNPDRYVTGMSHAGIGLPEREYYLREDAQFTEIRGKYKEHIARLLTLAGQSANVSDGEAKANSILALETEIARRHWPIADRRERDKTYNLRTRTEISALAPRFPWDALFDAAELGDVNEVVIAELSAIRPLAELFVATPVSTWRAYLAYHYLSNNAHVLPKAIDDENFDFFGRTLNGQPQQRDRWKRGVDAVNGALGEAIGAIYVQRHFPPEAKAQMQELVENLRRAYGERIDRLTWMTSATKVAAREKLASFRPKIGYPDRWRDYAGLDVRANDAFGNAKRQSEFDWRYDVARLDRPTDKDEWYMTPQTVNAYYNPVFNEVVFPAAILQAPFFDPKADPAVNYGAIGGVIGHEMGHGFDDQGAKSDARGVLRDWWSQADVEAFQTLTGSLAEQYSAFEPLPGIKVNGQLTLGENIGDNGGLQVAYYAYKLSQNGADPEVLDGVTGDQRFFLSWAQVWRTLIRDQRLRDQVLSDPHSPSEYRCNGTVRNMDAWYTAFNIQPGDKLYLPDSQRVEIW